MIGRSSEGETESEAEGEENASVTVVGKKVRPTARDLQV